MTPGAGCVLNILAQTCSRRHQKDFMTPPVERPIRNTLNRLEKTLLFLLLMVFIAFGSITLMRSAFMSYRHTDAGVYFRGAACIIRRRDRVR